jgi:hypothetical protein
MQIELLEATRYFVPLTACFIYASQNNAQGIGCFGYTVWVNNTINIDVKILFLQYQKRCASSKSDFRKKNEKMNLKPSKIRAYKGEIGSDGVSSCDCRT